MRFALGLPMGGPAHADHDPGMAAVADVARLAEDAGFDGCYVTDHPFPPRRWLVEGGHGAHDPFVALSFAAAATTRLRLHTHVLVLPYRNPFVVARAAASLDLLSGGRLTLGVAAGYLRGEHAALGADFEHRQDVADVAIRAMRRAWCEDEVALAGPGFEARGNTLDPKPVQRPIPVWVGGNGRRAIRRAVELGDAWIPFPNPAAVARHTRSPALETIDDLAAGIGRARALARELGRTAPLTIGYAVGPIDARSDPGLLRERVAALTELGVTWASVRARAATVRELATVLGRAKLC